MRAMLIFTVVIMMISLPLSVMGEPIKAMHAVELDDPAGDVQNTNDDPGKDVVKLMLASDGKDLQVTMVLDKDISHYLVGHKAGDVLQVNIDTDNNTATGGKTFWGNKEGFEYIVRIRTCIKYKDGEACVGGFSSAHEKFFTSYEVKKFQQGSTSIDDVHDIFWESSRVDIKGNTVVSKISYSDIDVSSGQTIRIAVREADSSYDAKSFFPEIIFTLK